MADVNFVELLRDTVRELEELLGGHKPNIQIYTEQCKALVHGFVQVRNILPTLLDAANGVRSAEIFKELYCLACGAVQILKLCCEQQTWLRAVILLKVHTRNGPNWSTFETLRDELDWCIDILRGNITSTRAHVNRLTRRDRETYDEENLRQKLRNHAVESENLQEVAIANFLLTRLDVRSNGQALDPHCKCIQQLQLSCWQLQHQETVPLIHPIKRIQVLGTRVGVNPSENKPQGISYVSRNLTWFGINVAEKAFLKGDDIRRLWEKEAQIMATLTHPNVVSFIGCLDDEEGPPEGPAIIKEGPPEEPAIIKEGPPKGPAIIMECEKQSLQDYIFEDLQQRNNRDVQTAAEMRQRATPLLELVVAVDLLTQIASGMAYLHSQDVAHLDLKPANLLITSHTAYEFLHVKIADFGESIQLKGRSGKIRNRWGANLGTTIYRAPELFHGDNWVCFKSADVCSFGFTAWAILHCHEPKLENVCQGRPFYYNALVAGWRLGFGGNIPVELQNLVKLCWDTNPDIRPPFSEIYWFLQSYKAKLLGSQVPLVQLQQRTARPRSGIRLWPGTLCLGSRQGHLDEQHEESV